MIPKENFIQYIFNNKRYVLIVFLLLFGMISWSFMFWWSRRIIWWTATTGEIISIDTSISDGKKLYRPIYEFYCNNQKRNKWKNWYNSTHYIIGETNTIWCNGDTEYINNSTSLNIIGVIISFCSIIWALFLLYKKFILFSNEQKIYKYWNRITTQIKDIYSTWAITNGKKEYKIIAIKDNHLFESESIINDKIYLIKKWENIDILVMDMDNPIEYLILREEKLASI